MNYKNLWIQLLVYIGKSKTSYGKNELLEKMRDMELEEARKEKYDKAND